MSDTESPEEPLPEPLPEPPPESPPEELEASVENPETSPENLERAAEKIQKALGEDLLGLEPLKTVAPLLEVNLMIRVRREAWIKTAELMRDGLNCKWFDFLSAIDWMDSPYGRQMEAEQDVTEAKRDVNIEWGILGGETRLQILARVRSIDEPLGIILKADVPDEEPLIDSWTPVYPGADWHERETWEMFGIGFNGHPGLHHLYLPSGFEGHPLRKDFPLLARKIKPWPGIVDVEGMPGMAAEDEENSETESEAVS